MVDDRPFLAGSWGTKADCMEHPCRFCVPLAPDAAQTIGDTEEDVRLLDVLFPPLSALSPLCARGCVCTGDFLVFGIPFRWQGSHDMASGTGQAEFSAFRVFGLSWFMGFVWERQLSVPPRGNPECDAIVAQGVLLSPHHTGLRFDRDPHILLPNALLVKASGS